MGLASVKLDTLEMTAAGRDAWMTVEAEEHVSLKYMGNSPTLSTRGTVSATMELKECTVLLYNKLE